MQLNSNSQYAAPSSAHHPPAAMDREQMITALQQALQLLQSSSSLASSTSSLNHQGQLFVPRREKKRRLGSWLVDRLVLWSVIWVALTIGLLSLLDATISVSDVDRPTNNSGFVAGTVIIIILQSIQLMVVVAVSVKLTKQMLHHTASSLFLVQSYCSTILLYSAIYTLIYRLDSNSFINSYTQGSPRDSSYVSQIFVRMLYFSISTFTSTGYGDIVPLSWYTYLIVSSQMMLGVLYGTVILARGMDILSRQMSLKPSPSSSTHTSVPLLPVTMPPRQESMA